MARAPRLDDLLKSFGSPGLGLVKRHDGRVGVAGALLDALQDEPHLALQLRRRGLREAIPGVIDGPESRVIIGRICEDDKAMQQAGAILEGTPHSLVIDSLLLLHLLPFTPCLPIGGIAALTEPHDTQRRVDVARHIGAAVAAGWLPAGRINGLNVVDYRNYADWPGRLAGSIFLDAWLGTLESRSQPLFSEGH